MLRQRANTQVKLGDIYAGTHVHNTLNLKIMPSEARLNIFEI